MLLQVVPQSIPAGELVMAPVPLPVLATVSDICCKAKSALTLWLWSRVTVQVVAVPVQAPVQPVKVESVAGLAARVTGVFLL